VVNVSVAMRPGAAIDADGLAGGEGALDRQLKRFFEQNGRPHPAPSQRQVTGLGSGFIVDASGYVVTNNHLVADAERVTVVLSDHSRHVGRVVGRDEATDIALLKIDAPVPLPHVEWADSDTAKVGDWVIAVGNPFGLAGTVTAGIISARGRDIDEGPYDDFLQIDAPINRGNSGGPTFNLDGEVLGINTAIYSPSGGSIGIGFAIPASFARQVVSELKAKGRVDHGWLGVTLQDVSPGLARSFGVDPGNPVGALVDDVVDDSPAARAGLRQGDVILSVNGQPVRTAHDLPRLVGESAIGTRIGLALRRDGRDRSANAVVGQKPELPQAAAETEGSGSSEPQAAAPHTAGLGLELKPLTAELRHRLQLPKSIDGVFVADIAPSSPAVTLGLKAGDVIVSIERRKVTSPHDVAERLAQALGGGQALVLVNRNGISQFLGASPDDREADARP
jgi:serine protease Do